MKAPSFTLLLLFSCLSFVSAQKKYKVKDTTLDNKVYKGLMFQVRDKDFLVLPNSANFDYMVKKNNISRTKSFDYRIVKDIQIRKKGSIGKGILIGYVAGIVFGVLIANGNKDNDNASLGISKGIQSFSTIFLISTGGLILGGIGGGGYPNYFTVKNDSTSIQSLKTELKKYEWYHAEEGLMK